MTTAVRLSQTCPQCGQALVVRTNHRTAERFLGCTGYPQCCFTELYEPRLAEALMAHSATAQVQALREVFS